LERLSISLPATWRDRAASGTYEVIKLLPTDGDDCQYPDQELDRGVERVAKESQLDVS